MKKILVIILVFGTDILLLAQGFVARTNEISMDFNKPPVNASLPQIKWISPDLESSYSNEASLLLEIEIKSETALTEIALAFIVGGERKEKKFAVTGGEFIKKINQKVTLLNGENIFEVIVENDKGGKVSSTRSVLSGMDGGPVLDLNRKDYALIFVTDKYDHWDDLINPINDGLTIKEELEKKYGFNTEVVENATYQEVMDKLYDYNTKKFNIQDQLFIFFAGHGYFDETLGEGYVVASNSLENDKGKTTYIPHAILRQRIDNIKCNHILLTMDVCFGGTIDPLLARARGQKDVYAEATDTEYLMRKLSKRARKFLTSGNKEYVSDGVAGKHSPFAAKFIQALRESGSGNDRILSLTKLQTYFLKLPTEPRSGIFGSDEAGSDFVFVGKVK